MSLAEQLGVRRVRDLAVERDDVAAARADRGQGLAVGQARGHLLAEIPRRQVAAARLERVLFAALGRGHLHRQLALPAELGDRLLGVVEWLAVLARLVLDRLDAPALLGAGDDRGR